MSQTDRHVNLDITHYPSEEELESLGYYDSVVHTVSLEVSTVTGKDGQQRLVHLGKIQDAPFGRPVERSTGYYDEERRKHIIYLLDMGGGAYWLPDASLAKDSKGRDIPILVYGDPISARNRELIDYRILRRDHSDFQHLDPFGGPNPGLEASRNWTDINNMIQLEEHEPRPVQYRDPFTADWCARFPDMCPQDPSYKVTWEETGAFTEEGEAFEPEDRPSPFTMPWSDRFDK